jgi:hypothetical protein
MTLTIGISTEPLTYRAGTPLALKRAIRRPAVSIAFPDLSHKVKMLPLMDP